MKLIIIILFGGFLAFSLQEYQEQVTIDKNEQASFNNSIKELKEMETALLKKAAPKEKIETSLPYNENERAIYLVEQQNNGKIIGYIDTKTIKEIEAKLLAK